MFWADKTASDIKKRGLKLEWVDDMKTPSGKVHVGAFRGVLVHDLIYKTLKDAGVDSKYTYVFEDHDPMDSLPNYLPKEKFEQYMGTPLYKIPSPEPGFNNYAEFYADDFKKAFNSIGCNPEIVWTRQLYESGRMNDDVKLVLDKSDQVRKIYEELYDRKMSDTWFPFQVFCPECGKVSTTTVYKWDGEFVHFTCDKDRLDWTKGCGYEGKISPFSSKDHMAGKLPWKIEWAVKWKVIGVTVEGGGKDHMSAGGSHDFAKLVCERIINYPVPYPLPYEFFLVGGKKMSSSKGLGSSASDMVEILPPELVRFLMIRPKLNQAINFDPSGPTIPDLFDDYQDAARAYIDKTDEDLARVFELSQLDPNKPKIPPLKARFINLTQWVQMPNAQSAIEEFGMEAWVKYARIWVDRFADDQVKYSFTDKISQASYEFNSTQKEFLKFIIDNLDKYTDAEELQKDIYQWIKDNSASSKDIFAAIYESLLGKKYGPKAAWLLLEYKDKVIERFNQVLNLEVKMSNQETENFSSLKDISIFNIDKKIAHDYPTISIGIATIKGVKIQKEDPRLEEEKISLLKDLSGLTTEQLGQYPEIISYRQLYRSMKIDWHSRRPSPEALLRRVALGKELYSINTCVDSYNLIVMRNRISVGAFDLDQIKFPTELRYARPGENINLLGDTEPTDYKETEIAYFDQDGGYNIDFNFRDAVRTSVNIDTKNLYINVDGVNEISASQVEESLRQTCDIITKYCGGEVDEFAVLTAKDE